jgi:hypothetical protein
MKNVAYYLALVLILSANAQLAKGQSKRVAVSGFDEVELAIAADCYLTQGETFECRLEGEQETLEEVEVFVSGSSLKIKYKKPWQFGNPDRIKVYVQLPALVAFAVTGSGDLLAPDPISTRALRLTVTGSGDISMKDLTVEDLQAKISGSGSIQVKGARPGDELDVKITGSGNYKGSGLAFENARVSISGSGNSYVKAMEDLAITVTGSGNVYYEGEALIDARVVGSGHVRKR